MRSVSTSLLCILTLSISLLGSATPATAFKRQQIQEKQDRNAAREDKSSQDKTNPGKRRRGQQAEQDALKIGDVAPNFRLKSLDGKSETNLAEFKAKKPVVLIFGSYT